MVDPLTEFVANNTTRVYYASGDTHGFVTLWNDSILDIIWGNHEDGVLTINGRPINEVLENNILDKANLKSLEFILRKYLTTKK